MGWGYGVVNGREVGYTVDAECDEKDCQAPINRGLAYCCGGMHGGGDHGCGGYFCAEHRYFTARRGELCRQCARYTRKEVERIHQDRADWRRDMPTGAQA